MFYIKYSFQKVCLKSPGRIPSLFLRLPVGANYKKQVSNDVYLSLSLDESTYMRCTVLQLSKTAKRRVSTINGKKAGQYEKRQKGGSVRETEKRRVSTRNGKSNFFQAVPRQSCSQPRFFILQNNRLISYCNITMLGKFTKFRGHWQ